MTVTCGNCLENPTNWQISIPIPTFLEKLRKGGFSLKHLRKIEVLKVSASGRISALMFLGSKSSVIISGHVLRRLLGANQVKSTLFTIAISGSESNSGDPISSLINSRKVKKQEKNGKMVLIKGKGYGHGVGLCQQGAIWLAARGKGYRSILDYYYQKIILKKMY
jgi:stage II sporulation protein D